MDFNSSDFHPTMAPATVFDSIIHQIQASNLNFKLQLSPFSADISIRKTPVKNKAGVPYPPKPHVLPAAVEDLIAKNLNLEEELAQVKNEYAIAINDAKTTRGMLEKLQKKNTEVAESKAVVDNIREDIKNLVEENNRLKRRNENKEIELRNLESLIKIKYQVPVSKY